MTKELETFNNILCNCNQNYPDFEKQVKIVENALKEHELMKDIRITARFDLAQVNKEHKALKIIKEKNVNVGDFKRCKSLEDYNDYCCYSKKEQLTQEEYDLLKEVLL